MEMVLISRADLTSTIHEAALLGATIALRKIPRNRPAQYSISDAAKEIGVSRPTLYKMINSGEIKLNECRKVPAGEIERITSSPTSL